MILAIFLYTKSFRGNVPYFGRTFLRSRNVLSKYGGFPLEHFCIA